MIRQIINELEQRYTAKRYDENKRIPPELHA